MAVALFRQEALLARHTRATGSIVLLRPLSMRLAALIAAVLGAALVCYVITAHYTRKVAVAGVIVPSAGAIQAVSLQSGRVVRAYVTDGEAVKEGQPLFDLSAERISRVNAVDSNIEALLGIRRDLFQKELDMQTSSLRQRIASIKARIRLAVAEVARLTDEIAAQSQHVKRARVMLARYQTLRSKGYVAEPQVAAAENEVDDQLSRLHALERTRRASQNEILQGQDDTDQLVVQERALAVQSQRNIAALDQEQTEQRGRAGARIVAPATGTVTAITGEVGQTVQIGAALATVLPAGSRLEARLSVPSSAIGFIEPGQLVLLRIAAFPYQKYGLVEGDIIRVEQAPMATSGSALAPGASAEPLYQIIVKLRRQGLRVYGVDKKFQSGMSVQANVQLDRRTLIEWILDPLLSVGGGRAMH